MTEDYKVLTESAAWIDLSERGRLCLIGADRQRFLNGQVTNNVKDLQVGQGCYAALITAKGKMVCDLNVWILQDEILLDFEPGLTEKVVERLEKFIIADDVQIVDASSSYQLVSLLGPSVEANPLWQINQEGETYVATLPRLGMPSRDFYLPSGSAFRPNAIQASMEAYETIRIEQGIPRFGIDMTEETLAPEVLDERAISYSKGCYIGQEVVARIRTYGQVSKALRGLRFEPAASTPKSGDKIFHGGKEVGWITSSTHSPKLNRPIALGYVRKECNQIGARLTVNDSPAEIVSLPFQI